MKGESIMIWIGEAIAIRLAKALNITLESITNEVLIPFGCKLGQLPGIYDIPNESPNWYIKYYAYDKSDWIKLSNKYSFLKITNQPLSNRYFD